MRNGPRDVLLAEALFEDLKLLKLMKKVDARMDYHLRNRLEPWNYRNITDRAFSCLPTHYFGQYWVLFFLRLEVHDSVAELEELLSLQWLCKVVRDYVVCRTVFDL